MTAALRIDALPELPTAVAMSPGDFDRLKQRIGEAHALDAIAFCPDTIEIVVSELLSDGAENWRWRYSDGWSRLRGEP